jgi:hypothetical protein
LHNPVGAVRLRHGHPRVGPSAAIYAGGRWPAFESVGDVERAVQVLRKHIASQSELCGVRTLNYLGLSAEPLDGRDRPEDLLASDLGCFRNLVKHSRLEEVICTLDRESSGTHLGAAGDSVIDQSLHGLYRAVIDERPDRNILAQSVSKNSGRHLLGESGNEGIGDAFLHVDPVRRDARLSAVAHLGGVGTVYGSLEISVVKNQEGASPPSSTEVSKTFLAASRTRA